ncbi:hypothetical protein [Paraburkholderia caffeinilytica]|uniref:hypothetical protein n=1 Tax=Paraburkholderia caffeinilytica TaxID=1761016 RepID=UPI003DA14C7C
MRYAHEHANAKLLGSAFRVMRWCLGGMPVARVTGVLNQSLLVKNAHFFSAQRCLLTVGATGKQASMTLIGKSISFARTSILLMLGACVHRFRGHAALTRGRDALASRAIAFERLDLSQYHSFVSAWDDSRQPVRCVLIRTPSEWQAIMQPAPVMFRVPQQFAPPDAFFERQQILLVARVTPAATDDARALDINNVALHEGVLSVDYQYRAPLAMAGFMITNSLLVAIPRLDVAPARIQFIENGRAVCSFTPAI